MKAKHIRGPEICYQDEDQKAMIEEAAYYQGISIKHFVTQAAIEKARELTQQRQQLLLSDRDFEITTDLLNNPPEPNEALKNLFK